MSEKQWPKCQAEGSETIIAWDDDVVGSREWEPFYGHLSSGEETVTQYTRTDIAEARIATLEAERDALQARIAQLEESAIGGYEDGWHALRNERDALRARIEGAQIFQFSSRARIDCAGLAEVFVPCEVLGKRVALVPLRDDE